MKNSIYSYDFFTIDKWGFESHVGNHTTRTFEKDLSGIRFTNIQAGTKDASFHQIKFQLHIPDLWIPRPEDDLMNPGDSIYEAAREKKKIGLVQLVRHSSTRLPHIVDTFIINPGNAINEIPTELLDNGEVLGTIQIDKPFSQKYGLSDVYGDTEYIYELRAGWYYLSNELSFLKNPLKLTVPNEFTGGKVGYSFHPYIYESPLSKDFSIIPKLGEDKHFLKVEALVDVCALAVYPKKNSFKKIPTLRCSLGSNRFGNNKILPYATITATIQKSTVEVLDHVEILVANSSDGSWLTLGKHKLTSGNFVFIDDVGPALSTNKNKYCIIGRNLSFDTVFKVAGNVISLQKYNFIERDDVSANSISVNPLTNNKLR